LSLLWPSGVLPEVFGKEAKNAQNQSIVINSNSLEIDNQRKIVTFTGDVDARQDDLIINCQKMVLYYIEEQTEKASKNPGLKIDKIVATGQVKITRPDGGSATAEKATYYQDDEKVVLTGKPVVKQGDDFVEGSMITLFLRENRSVVEGSENKKVRAVLSPRKGKR
jgi:lipopolysaccharide export system protein LptA